eukprot:jgi/Mesvir1/3224/Mv25608-RA.1
MPTLRSKPPPHQEEKPLGTGGPLALNRDQLTGGVPPTTPAAQPGPFFVIHAGVVSNYQLTDMLAAHAASGAEATVLVVPAEPPQTPVPPPSHPGHAKNLTRSALSNGHTPGVPGPIMPPNGPSLGSDIKYPAAGGAGDVASTSAWGGLVHRRSVSFTDGMNSMPGNSPLLSPGSPEGEDASIGSLGSSWEITPGSTPGASPKSTASNVPLTPANTPSEVASATPTTRVLTEVSERVKDAGGSIKDAGGNSLAPLALGLRQRSKSSEEEAPLSGGPGAVKGNENGNGGARMAPVSGVKMENGGVHAKPKAAVSLPPMSPSAHAPQMAVVMRRSSGMVVRVAPSHSPQGMRAPAVAMEAFGKPVATTAAGIAVNGRGPFAKTITGKESPAETPDPPKSSPLREAPAGSPNDGVVSPHVAHLQTMGAAGIYLFEPSVLSHVGPAGARLSLEEDVLPQLAAAGELFATPLTSGCFWSDMSGGPVEYLAGLAGYLASKNRPLLTTGPDATIPEPIPSKPSAPIDSGKGYSIVGNVCVDNSAAIGRGCVIGPDVSIGPRCIIGDGVRLSRCAIMEGARVGTSAIVKDSIVGWGCRVGRWARVESTAVLGEDVVLADEVMLNGAVVCPFKEIKQSIRTPQIVL